VCRGDLRRRAAAEIQILAASKLDEERKDFPAVIVDCFGESYRDHIIYMDVAGAFQEQMKKAHNIHREGEAEKTPERSMAGLNSNFQIK
jgi:hypothetical protein